MFLGLMPSDYFTIAIAIGTLVILEGLLSGDYALVLAVMVRHLPRDQRQRALLYGIWGAVVFRLIAIVLAEWLLRYWQLKVVGGLYLVFLAARHFLTSGHGEGEDEAEEAKKAFGRGFWGTVISVELADIAFSIDSILAAVAMVEGLPDRLQENRYLRLGIIYLGGVLGILMMRLVAGLFLKILDRFQGLAAGAYFLVAWIGLKLTGGGLHDLFHPRKFDGKVDPLPEWAAQVPASLRHFPWEMNNWIFWLGMLGIVAASMTFGGRAEPSRKSDEAPPIDPPGGSPEPPPVR